MNKKDLIFTGSIAGILGNIPKTLLTWTFYFMGLTKFTFVHISAGYFVSDKYLNHPLSLLVGFISDYTLAGVMGVLILLLLRYTGSDYALYKGAGFGTLMYIFLFGVAMAIDVTRVSITTPLPSLILLFPHILFGLTTAFLLSYEKKESKNQHELVNRIYRIVPGTLSGIRNINYRFLKKPIKLRSKK